MSDNNTATIATRSTRGRRAGTATAASGGGGGNEKLMTPFYSAALSRDHRVLVIVDQLSTWRTCVRARKCPPMLCV